MSFPNPWPEVRGGNPPGRPVVPAPQARPQARNDIAVQAPGRVVAVGPGASTLSGLGVGENDFLSMSLAAGAAVDAEKVRPAFSGTQSSGREALIDEALQTIGDLHAILMSAPANTGDGQAAPAPDLAAASDVPALMAGPDRPVVAAGPLTEASLLALMPLTLAEKIRLLFAQARQKICDIWHGKSRAEHTEKTDPERVLSLLTIGATADSMGSELAGFSGASPEQLDIANAAGFLAAAPFELYGVAMTLIEFFDTFGEQDDALRKMLLHYQGAERFHRHFRHPGSVVPLPGDALSFHIFTREMKKIPELSPYAKTRRDSVGLAMAQGLTGGLLRTAFESPLALAAPLGKPLLAAVGSALGMVSALLGFLGSGFETAEGVEKYDAARQRIHDHAQSHAIVASCARQYRNDICTSVTRLVDTVADSLKRQFLRCADECKMDRRLALAKTVRGGVGLVLFAGLGVLLIAAAAGLSWTPLGVALAVGIGLATVIYCFFVTERYRKIGEAASIMQDKQREADRFTRGASLAQLASLYGGEMRRYKEVQPGVYTRGETDQEVLDLADNPYFTLRFMALVFANKIDREEKLAGAGALPAPSILEGMAREQRLALQRGIDGWPLPFRRRLDAPAGAAMAAQQNHPAQAPETGQENRHDQHDHVASEPNTWEGEEVLPLTLSDQTGLEAIFGKLLEQLGMSPPERQAMEQLVSAVAENQRVALLEKLLAPVLHLPHISLSATAADEDMVDADGGHAI